jgi:hypothetical protein
MNIGGINLTKDNYFIAMQYYRLILNRTYLIIFTKSSLVGILGNGLVAAENHSDLTTSLSSAILRNIIIRGDLTNPLSYIKDKYIKMVNNFDLEGDLILQANSANFSINYADIKAVRYDPDKKWGMGYYPHDGKIYVKTRKGKTKEFIILGNQSGEFIKNLILSKML